MTIHIGRLQAIGFGKESPAGTQAVATFWAPKTEGDFMPEFETVEENSAYNTIDEVYDVVTTKETTKVTLNGAARDDWFGNILLAAWGQETLLKCITLTGASGGSPARGDDISSATGGWDATIRKILVFDSTTYYFVEETSGTIDAQTDVTDGVWTGATSAVIAGVYGHYFTRKNDNAHPSFTAYSSDPVGDEYATYCMLNKFELNVQVGQYVGFKTEWMGQKSAAASSQTPTFSEDNRFLAAHANVYFGDAESDLNGATAESLQSFNVRIEKNVEAVQDFVNGKDVKALHNKQFRTAGDLSAKYENTTLADYVSNSSKKAARLFLMNNDPTVAELASGSGIYPSLVIDLARAGFSEWGRAGGNNDLVSQTVGFLGELSTTDAFTIEAILINANSSAY